jgi:hypothetical protein
MKNLVRAGGLVTLVLALSTVWFYQRWRANDRAEEIMAQRPSVQENDALLNARLDIANRYGRAARSADETLKYIVFGMAGVGALQLLLTLLWRKHQGAGMLDFGLVSIVGAILTGLAHDRRFEPGVVALAWCAAVILVVARRWRTRRA